MKDKLYSCKLTWTTG